MPEGLPIDYEKGLNGTMPAYAEQLLICTGQEDWASRIEEENAGDNLAADVKELMGRGGVFSDVRFLPTFSPLLRDNRMLMCDHSHTTA